MRTDKLREVARAAALAQASCDYELDINVVAHAEAIAEAVYQALRPHMSCGHSPHCARCAELAAFNSPGRGYGY